MTLALPLILIAAAAADPSAEQRARDVLAQSRAALGGRAAAPRSLSLEADLRRVQPVDGGEARDMSGELAVDAQLPDRYLRIESLSPVPGMPPISIGTGLDGGEVWRAPMGGGAGPHMVVRVAGAEGPAATEAMLRRTRSEMLRLLLVALGQGPAEGTLKFAHAGEAEAPEGRAERIEVSDGEGLVGTLFIDKATHRPLMMSFKTVLPRMAMVRATSHADAERAAQAAQAAAPPREVQAQLYVSDWKPVDGVLLPHRVAQTVEGGASEEWTIKKWTLDPAFKADHFKRRK
jgi:hypothetical protein